MTTRLTVIEASAGVAPHDGDSESSNPTTLVTLKLRVKDKHAARLNRQARAVNVTFNYCNEVQKKAALSRRNWLSVHDLMRLTAGAGKRSRI